MLDTAIRLLFIGNSLTAANALPATVEGIGAASGIRIDCTTIAKPNFSLEDHWNDGEARRAIARGGWTFVVLQQGPSALPESRVLLEEYVRRFDTIIRAAGAKTAVFMVWPSSERAGDFAGVSRSYTSAAVLVGARLFPAGDAWQAAWRRSPRLGLYGPDGFHPSTLGSRLAAAVIVRGLTGRPLTPAAFSDLPPAEQRILLEAVEDVSGAKDPKVVPAGRGPVAREFLMVRRQSPRE